MRDELDAITTESDVTRSPNTGSHFSMADVQRLSDWFQEFMQRAVFVPADPEHADAKDNLLHHTKVFTTLFGHRGDGNPCDPKAVNESLHALGAEAWLRWRTDQTTTNSDKTRNRHHHDRGGFRLRQRSGEVARSAIRREAA